MTNNDPLSQYNPTDVRAVWEVLNAVFDSTARLETIFERARNIQGPIREYALSGEWRKLNEL